MPRTRAHEERQPHRRQPLGRAKSRIGPRALADDSKSVDPASRPNLDEALKPSESATLKRIELFEQGTTIDLLRAAYLTHRFAAHVHEEYAIGVVESGAIRTRVRHDTVVIPAGRIIVLNPGDVHTGEPADRFGYRYRMFYVGESLLRSFIGCDAAHDGAAFTTPIFRAPALDDLSLASRLVRAHAMLESDGNRFAAECELADTMEALALRHAAYRRPTPGSQAAARIVRVVREFLEDEHARVVTLAELSGLTGRSPFYVSRIFREAVGVPPYAYLALVRVRRARELIARGYPLSYVTHATGFSDQSHLTKQFKRIVGVSPGQYAREATRASGVDSTRGLTLAPTAAPDGPMRRTRSWTAQQRASA